MVEDIKYELQKIKDSIGELERGNLYMVKERLREILSTLNDIKSRLDDIKNSSQN
ncbi:MAG TPA: hypothetical protein P5089_02745 [Candidatus Portnoybacteria bacterium]|nr:hypothetical protein [Candidatus Portnoybacteria bacterium]